MKRTERWARPTPLREKVARLERELADTDALWRREAEYAMELHAAAQAYAEEAHAALVEDAVCDHAVGICWCGYRHALQALYAALAKNPAIPEALK